MCAEGISTREPRALIDWLTRYWNDSRTHTKNKAEMTPQNDPLLKQAECLVEVSQINAIALYQSARNDFLFLQDMNVNHWESILTIAGVFMAAHRLKNLRLNEQREQILMKRIAERLSQWEPGYAIRGFEDCKSFFERAFDSLTGHNLRFAASDALGSWIVLNILGRPANSEEDWKLVRTVGASINKNFFDWWEEKA
jgi:hypothetical protein